MPRQGTFSDGWLTLPVKCEGGLILSSDILSQSATQPGSAIVLQNFEPSIEGGYKRLLGFSKFDPATVPGDDGSPVLGVKVGLEGVVACRFDTATNDNALYFSTGSGWGSKINTVTRPGNVVKMRGLFSAIISPSIIILDGINPAGKWDGTTWTTINGTGAPADPKWGAVFVNRLVLGGYSANPQEISISEPNTDIAFTGGGGAISIPCSDVIKGIRTFRDELFIYCENSIKKLVGDSITNFKVVDVTSSIGCLSGDTIQENGGDLIFLAPDGFRSTAATSRIGDIELGLLSKEIQPLVRIQLAKSNSEDKFSSCVIRAKNQYRVFFNDGDTEELGQLGFLGALQPRQDPLGSLQYEWATTLGIKPYCADSAYTNNQEVIVFGHPTDGYVRRMEQSTSFDGQPISAIYRTPNLVFNEDQLRKVNQRVTTYAELDGDASITFKIYLERSEPGVPQPVAQSLSKSVTLSTYGTAIYGLSIYGSLSEVTFNTPTTGSGRIVSFEYSSNDTNPSYRIDDFTVTYALKGYR